MNYLSGRDCRSALKALMFGASVLVAIAIPAAPAAAQTTNVVVNGSFESPPSAPLQDPSKYDTLPAGTTVSNRLVGWTIGGHSIDHVGRFWKAADGVQSIDLDGTAPGAISQTIATLPGRNYKLTFQYSAHPDRGSHQPQMTVRFGGFQKSYTFTGKSTKNNMGWVQAPVETITATSSSTVLSFTSDDIQNPYGIALDNVSLTLEPLPYNLSTPSVLRVFATNYKDQAGAYVIGRVDGATNLPITIQAYSAQGCESGLLTNGGTAVGSPVAPIDPTASPGSTDVNGYFGAFIPGVASGAFVAVAVATPVTTQKSACLVSSGDNDTWPKALAIDGFGLTAQDYIDIPGRARWYKVNVLPDQRLRVLLSGLPADYDVAVFRDIETSFRSLLGVLGTAEVTRLSAEYAPSAFSPSAFSPSAFSPSAFSPDAYSPSAFSPSAFSADVYSPSAFSPSAFSPSAFSPSAFSPSAFSPSAFSPSAFSPSAFSPSAFSPAGFDASELERAFSSAQTRSIVAVSATPGTVDESVVVDTWNNTGNFYVRVASRGGAYSTANPGGKFTVTVTKEGSSCPAPGTANIYRPVTARAAASSTGITTVILTDSFKLPAAASGGALRTKLEELATRVSGVVVDVEGDAEVRAKRKNADDFYSCPYAKNLLAEEIKGIVDSYRDPAKNPGLKYVVLAGGDSVIPFFRYPDQSLLGQESGYFPPVRDDTASQSSLRRDFVLGQDAYGAGSLVSIRTTNFPVPGLAVGRLVETADEIVGMIDAYLTNDAYMNNGVVVPKSSLVTGYDFLEDAAIEVKSELTTGIGTGGVHSALITPSQVSPEGPREGSGLPQPWTAADLAGALFGQRHDVIFLAGHFSANSALAADFETDLLTTDLAASTVNLKNAIIFSAGCHSGYNLLDGDKIDGVTEPLDWVQAFARKQATLIAGTGYQYGDTDFLEYSERIYRNFARQLRAGAAGTSVSVGEAFVKAKREYLESTPDVRGLHEKALLEATLFGLPMMSVNMEGTRYAPPSTGAPIAPAAVSAFPWSDLGLWVHDTANFAGSLTNDSVTLQNIEGGTKTAQWLTGPNGVISYPAEPTLPLNVVNVTPTNGSLVLRGVGFREGAYKEETILALTGAATTELRGVHVPFVSPVFYPMRPWIANYYGALAGTGGTNLQITPAQHRALDIEQGMSLRRQYNDLRLRLFYSSNTTDAATSDAPIIVNVKTQEVAGTVTFTAQVTGDPKAAIYQVWITHTTGPGADGNGRWSSLDLTQCVAPLPTACTAEDSQLWAGQLPAPATPGNFRYIVQAASGTGLVALDDNRGLYYGLAGSPNVLTSLTLLAPSLPASGKFGENVEVKAKLSVPSDPGAAAGKSVVIGIGGAARVGLTNDVGEATVSIPLVLRPGLNYTVIASFVGDDTLLPSGVSAFPFTVNPADASLSALTLMTPTASEPDDRLPTYLTTLTAPLGNPAKLQPLLQEAIEFEVLVGETRKWRGFANTDYLGRAYLPPTGLGAGAYTLRATFGGNATYTPAVTSSAFSIRGQTFTLEGDPLPATLTLPGSVRFKVSSTTGQPVTVTLTSGASMTCLLTQDVQGWYMLAGVAAGSCTIQFSVDGTVIYASTIETKVVNVVQGTQTLGTFEPKSSLIYRGTDTYPTATSASQSITWAVTEPCSFTGGAVLTANSGTGTCVVSGTALGTAVYAPFSYTASVDLAKATQSIDTFTVPASVTYALNGTFPVSATTTPSGRTVTFSSTSTACSVSESTVKINAVGTCIVTATLAADTNFAPTVTQSKSVTITQALQTITFNAPATKQPTDPPFEVSATASSGLPVAFSATGVCTVGDTTLAGNISTATVTLTGVGNCTINANQPGNAFYVAATQVTQALTVAAGTFLSAGTMAQPRSYHTATLLCGNDGVLIAGGFDARGQPTATSELYRHGTSAPWTTKGNLPSKAAAHVAVLVGITAGNRMDPCSAPTDSRVLVIGGGNSSLQSYAPATGTWSPAGGLGSNRSHHTATRLNDGRVLIVGGSDPSGVIYGSTLIYDPVSGAMSDGPPLRYPRERHTATLLGTGEVLIAGGRVKVGSAYTAVKETELYDPVTGAFVTPQDGLLAEPNGRGRFDHRTAGLGSGPASPGRAIAIGGNDGTVSISTARIYATETDAWSATGSLAGARSEHAIARLGSDVVLVAGGRGGSSNAVLKSAEIFVNSVFSPLPPAMLNMLKERYAHTATPFACSTATGGSTTCVLITGGVGPNGKAIADTEYYQ